MMHVMSRTMYRFWYAPVEIVGGSFATTRVRTPMGAEHVFWTDNGKPFNDDTPWTLHKGPIPSDGELALEANGKRTI